MTPDDVLIEAIAAASLHGDSPYLRETMCRKLEEAVRKLVAPNATTQTIGNLTVIKSGKE